MQIGMPRDVAVDSKGNIYYSDFYIKKFSQAGRLDEDFMPEGLNDENYGSFSVTFDAEDNLYVVSYSFAKIAKFHKDGSLLYELGGYGSEPGQFIGPEEIAVNSKGEIYVVDTGNRRIQRFDKDLNLLEPIVFYADTDTLQQEAEYPFSIAFDKEDNLYALYQLNFSNGKVVKFNAAGEKLLEFGNNGPVQDRLNSASHIAVDQRTGQVYVTETAYGSIYVYNTSGEFQQRIYHQTGEGRLWGTIIGISLDPEGNIIVSDRRHNGSSKIIQYNKAGDVLQVWGGRWRTKDLALDDHGYVYQLDITGEINKFNPEGEVVSKFGRAGNSPILAPQALTIDYWGNIYAMTSFGSYSASAIYKFDSSGNLLEVYTDFGPGASFNFFTDLAVDASGNLYVSDFTDSVIRKLKASGELLEVMEGDTLFDRKIVKPTSLAIDMLGQLYVLDNNGARVQKFNAQGKFIWSHGWVKPNMDEHYENSQSSIAVDGKGYLYISSNVKPYRFFILDQQAELVYEEPEVVVLHVAVDRKASCLVWYDYKAEAYTSYRATNYQEPQRLISGRAFRDTNQNCTFEEEEEPFQSIVIEATPGPFYTLTGPDGRYTLPVDSGTYTLRSIAPDLTGRLIVTDCPPQKVALTGKARQIENIDFGFRADDFPYLRVSVSSTRRRRCFESITTVSYSNIGYATAPDAKVYLQLPKEVGLQSANKPYTLLPDGTYQFSVGDLAAGQSGTILIQDIVLCGDESVRGLTVCTRAWITPSNNKPAEPTPTVSITGRCNAETGMIRFVVRNTGTADMDQYELFRKFANGELASQEHFRLAAGDSLVLWVPSMGYTWRLEADQPDGNGDNTAVSVTIEGCPSGDVSSVSKGMVNIFPSDDEEAERAVECMMITDSYDPNDKLVTPVGRTVEFYTPTNTALKYKIRFQNTGTDVAYRIVVVDTLSEHLDLSTLQLGVTSHPSHVEVSGKGRPVLTWTFDNIMLPDSTADEPGSHGYIQFSIKPKADLAEKTLVENFADIFFDFNSPIRTNVTQNRIYDMPPVINESVRVHLEDVLATPGIAGFSPSAGRFGTEVTITGQRFAVQPSDNKVYLNGKAVTVVSATATELKVLVPTGTATGNLKVITPDGGVTSANKFEVYQPPVLSSFSPAEGMVGQTVTLTGEHLQAELIEEIRLGDLSCEILSNNGSRVTVRVPAEARTGSFQINTKGGEAISSSAYAVWYVPGITGISKETDIVGASIVIRGENFATDKTRNKVRFGQALAEVLEASTQQLTVRVPEGAESGFISLETPGGKTTAATLFEVIPGPKFTAMQPGKGMVGTVVEISGEHFGIMGQQDVIAFNGQQALVLESEGNKYKVRVPRGASTGKVTITGFGGKAHSSTDFVVEELSPAEAISIYPNPNKGEFTVSLRHADFDVQRLEVYDALGKRLHQTHIAGPRPEAVEINLPSAKAGLYFLQIQTERGLITKKLTVL